MQPDTTFVEPITQLVTNPVFTQAIIALIIGAITYVVGLLKLPKNVVAKIVQYGAIIVISIIETHNKANIDEARGTQIMTNEEKLQFASQLVTATVEKSPDRNIFSKITKVLGGVASVVNVAFPIVKPFLKKK
jgi:uncharacterized membrane protein YiaA